MKSRPILFSGAMVRALLDGTKTQTRRVVKPQPSIPLRSEDTTISGKSSAEEAWEQILKWCPYGQPGDRLWVRETWAVSGLGFMMKPRDAALIASPSAWKYKADDPTGWQHGWKPSIHMPRWASRITLEIVSVRVERLHEISRGDAMAEGCPFANMANGDNPRDWYRDLWESINGPGSWDANPFVWVVEFQRVEVEVPK